MIRQRAHDQAEDFELKDQSGDKHGPSEFHGKNLLLYFAEDGDKNTLEAEAVEFQEYLQAFKDADTEVVGVAPDSKRTMKKIAKEHHIAYPLLADKRHKAAEKYGVWNEDRKTVENTMFLIDKDGRIEKVYPHAWNRRDIKRALTDARRLEHAEEWDATPMPEFLAESSRAE